jgi:hypothetical protein
VPFQTAHSCAPKCRGNPLFKGPASLFPPRYSKPMALGGQANCRGREVHTRDVLRSRASGLTRWPSVCIRPSEATIVKAPPRCIARTAVKLAWTMPFAQQSREVGGIPDRVGNGVEHAIKTCYQTSRGHKARYVLPPCGPGCIPYIEDCATCRSINGVGDNAARIVRA